MDIVALVIGQLFRRLTDYLRASAFGRTVFGPRIAQPLAAWLEANFGAPESQSAPIAPVPLHEPPDDSVLLDSAEAVADSQTEIPSPPETAAHNGVRRVVAGVTAGIKDHNLVVVAAGIAFWGLLAIPAVLFSVVSVAGLVLDPATVRDQVNSNLSGLPEEARTIIGDQLAGISGASTGGLVVGVVVGLLLAFWTSSGAMAKVMAALNTIYEVRETRNFAVLRGWALALTLGGIVFLASALFLLAALPAWLDSIDSLGDAPATVFNVVRFPLLGLVMMLALGVLYHVGPNRTGPYRPLAWGPAIATLLWVALSGLFSVYTATVATYNETYGSIGGIVVLLMWLFITAFVVLLGAEISAATMQSDAPHDASSQTQSRAAIPQGELEVHELHGPGGE